MNGRAVFCVDDRAAVCVQHAQSPKKGMRTCGDNERTCREANDHAPGTEKCKLLLSTVIALKVPSSPIEPAPYPGGNMSTEVTPPNPILRGVPPVAVQSVPLSVMTTMAQRLY